MSRDFLKCGALGCCIELFWTMVGGVRKKDYKLICHTSVWMFPIYGMAAIIKPVANKLKSCEKDTLERGVIYAIGIFSIEYISGMLLKKKNRCPWDYSKNKYNINGVIRLDYAPLWFALGLMYEKILLKKR